jgi:cyclophilin family peptidyl-prolyl cis-trans isomerase
MPVRTLVFVTACCLIAAIQTANISAQDNPTIAIETSLGTITAELDRANAPISVENFLQYVEDGHYTGTIFHRVTKDFMILGGGFTADMTPKPTRAAIKNEARNGVQNARGTLAMARSDLIDSATTQFFINTANNGALDNRGVTPDEYGYAVFGRVTEGLNVVETIENVATSARDEYRDLPVTPIEILSITVH